MSNPLSATATTDRSDRVSPPRWLTPLLLVDGYGSPVIGVTLTATSGLLAGPFGLDSVVPIVLVGLLFVVNGPVNLAAGRAPTRRRLTAPIAIDSLFGVVLLLVAITDPTGAESWARWSLVVVAVLSFDLALAKAVGARRTSPASRSG